MGLDMFLLNKNGSEVGYWRKANQIHAWIINNKADGIDDCQEIPMTKGDLKELYDICVKVNKDRKTAQKLLPPQSGFFFGSTDIDEWYFRDIQETIDVLSPIVNNLEINSNERYIYVASW